MRRTLVDPMKGIIDTVVSNRGRYGGAEVSSGEIWGELPGSRKMNNMKFARAKKPPFADLSELIAEHWTKHQFFDPKCSSKSAAAEGPRFQSGCALVTRLL